MTGSFVQRNVHNEVVSAKEVALYQWDSMQKHLRTMKRGKEFEVKEVVGMLILEGQTVNRNFVTY